MNRTLLALVSSVIIGIVMVRRYPFPDGDAMIQVLGYYKPWLVYTLARGWQAMLFTTPFIVLSALFSLVFIYAGKAKQGTSVLPPYPKLQDRDPLMVVIGEVHHQRKFVPIETPTWLTIPERGLYTGLAVFGAIGSGKTSCCMYPFAKQIFNWRAKDEAQRVGGLVLEVKGDFCYQVKEILECAARPGDYIELSLDTEYRYNPLHNTMDEFSVSYAIGSLLTNLYGRGKEPFWQQASSHALQFLLLLFRVADGYCTFLDLYRGVLQIDLIRAKIAETEERLAEELESESDYLTISLEDYTNHPELTQPGWKVVADQARIAHTAKIAEELYRLRIMYLKTEAAEKTKDLEERLQKLEAVKVWFEDDWTKLKPDLRTSVAAGITSFLSMFDADPRMKLIFCPPKECYSPEANGDYRYGRPLPSWDETIEQGKVVALNFPTGENPALARCIGVMMKLDFQRALIGRISRMAKTPKKPYRPCLFLCDEYHMFATVGEESPTGDEKFFALSRQAKCISVVATQSISSLKSALNSDNAWRTLLQTFRTKIFLCLSDDFSATIASELCGKDEQTVVSHSTSESGQDARVGLMTGRLQSHKSSVTINTSFQPQIRPIFQPLVFSDLKNAQAIVRAYDGVNPLPSTIAYLKPYYLEPNESYFAQLAGGKL